MEVKLTFFGCVFFLNCVCFFFALYSKIFTQNRKKKQVARSQWTEDECERVVSALETIAEDPKKYEIYSFNLKLVSKIVYENTNVRAKRAIEQK